MQSYPSLSGSAVGTVIKDGWRFTLSVSDNKALSRALCLRKFGINTRLPPHINIHSWMQKSQSSYKADIAASIVYYQPLTSSSWRLRIIITTQEMQDAAWKYGHNGQLVMDGTFGVSSTKILLFVLLTVDVTGRGLPIGYLIFTPLHGQRTHAGYDTAVLRELLINWSSALGTRHGMQFAPKLAITDTCVRERAAIKSVWPDIQLRLCTFHVRQAWNNHKKQCIRSNGIADNGSSSRALVGESIMNLHKHSEKDAIFLSLDVAQPQSPDPQAGGQTGAQIQLSDSIPTDILALVDWGDVADLVDEEGNDEERGVSDNSSSSIIGDDDEEVGELDGINEVAMLRLERSLDSDDGVKETPIPSSRVDEGLQFQAQSRLRHDTDRAIGMLCDVLKQSASLSLDFRDWAKPDLHHVLASIEEIMKLDTPSRPLGAGIQAARSAPLLMPLPREEKHRRRHPSTSAL
ncbi:unnamed protein product [Tilletia controversa]|nr:unnamed protein product [Tilletia controversa]